MSAVTKIEWSDATWNATRGCSRVSEGCRHCYAERYAARFSGGRGFPYNGNTPEPFYGFAEMTESGPRWTGKVALVREKLEEPLRWKKPRRIFVNSMSDLFHESLPDDAIDRVFAVMVLSTPELRGHTFQVLTKRPERMQAYLAEGRQSKVVTAACAFLDDRRGEHLHWLSRYDGVWPPPQVWLGVSVEDQSTADERIPLLLQTPAAVRFVSYEPALGPVNFRHMDVDAAGHKDWCQIDALTGRQTDMGRPCHDVPRLDWLIVGGESGPGARPFDVAWARSVIKQCREAGVPCFVKQLGSKAYLGKGAGGNYAIGPASLASYPSGFLADPINKLRHPKGGDPLEWGPDLNVREFPGPHPERREKQ